MVKGRFIGLEVCMTKQESLEQLYNEYRTALEGNEIVLGDGNINSEVLLIGEAPGKDEVKQGKPFVGAAGKNLTEFLSLLGLARQEIYITNAIKYRLSETNPQTSRVVNRPATRKEIEQNRVYLLKEIEIIDPIYIVTLGNVPLKAISEESKISIGNVHGQLIEVTVLQKEYKLFPLYHPASIIYNRNLKSIYLNDIEKLSSIVR